MTGAQAFPFPDGAWDCHVHVVGTQDAYPMVEDRQYTAGPATAADLAAHLARHGLARAVIVQPSFYGIDNRCLLDALRELDGAARGVAVLPEDIGLQQLLELHAAGVRGIRLNLESAAVRDPAAIGAGLSVWADKIAPLGWHIQTYAAPQVIAAVAERIARLPVRFVLDHFAMVPAATDPGDPCLQALLELVRGGNTYVKLSAPYRVSDAPLAHADQVARLAALFYDANPDRMLWATDWPHTNREPGVHRLDVSRYRDIPDAMLTQALEQWAQRPDVLRRICVDNPSRLYD